ncbi:hypothetical protein HanXRQr2_Chr17g0814351 [Helianthus annuus]|uniref:Uncharacterized protein n=1 Tax=Helianthus annuus TaxID=4232 RepID=A0A9K3GUZ4_HELAN|nr:hypothetical protein HanXRQr2_Chr17g0814351 [Helianthus annuus]
MIKTLNKQMIMMLVEPYHCAQRAVLTKLNQYTSLAICDCEITLPDIQGISFMLNLWF